MALLVEAPARAAEDQACTAWGDLLTQGSVISDEITELSGVAASPRSAGRLWVHDDSGGGNTLYAIAASDGAYQGRVEVVEADNEDWEDLAIGPCPDEDCGCLYIADAGSSDGSRTNGVLWIVPEPDLADGITVAATAIPFTWPDGGHDAEALLVDPVSGETLLVTKEPTGPAGIYAFPQAPPHSSGGLTLEKVGEIDLSTVGAAETAVTGGAVSPGGERLALRTDEDLLVFTIGDDGLIAALSHVPVHLDAPKAQNGEAVTFSADGSALYLINEGSTPILWSLPCAESVDAHAVDNGLGACAPLETKGCGCASAPPAAGSLALLGGLFLALGGRRLPRRARPEA